MLQLDETSAKPNTFAEMLITTILENFVIIVSSKRALGKTVAIGVAIVIIVAVVGAGMVFLTGQIGPTPTPTPNTGPSVKKVRIAVLLPGSITDSGWNANMYKAALGLNSSDPNVEVAVAEGLGQAGPAVDTTIRNFARRGYDIIVLWTIGYQDAALKIAPEFPKIYFWGTAFWNFGNLTNLGSYRDKSYDVFYLEGMIAGAMTKTNTVGWIDGQEFPLQNAMANAYHLGALRTNPNVRFRWAFAGVWDDVNKGREVAKALTGAGVDVLATRGDGVTLGAIQAASQAGIWVFGDMIDQHSLSPQNMLSSYVWNDDVILKELLRLFRAGKLFGGDPVKIDISLAAGTVNLAPYHELDNKIPANVRQEVEKVKAELKAGTFQVPEILESPKERR